MLAVYHDGSWIVAAAGMIMALFLQPGQNIPIFFGLNDGPALETAAAAFRIYALSVALTGVNVVTTSSGKQ